MLSAAEQPPEPVPEGSARRLRLALAASLAVAALLLVPAPLLPPGPEELAPLPLDKLVHALLFFALGRAWRRALPDSRRWTTILLLAAYGGALELVQGATGWRSAEWGDLVADALGAAAAGWLAWPFRSARLRGPAAPRRPRRPSSASDSGGGR